MKLYEVKNTEEYWIKAIEDFFRLGMKEASVPTSNLDYSTAKTIGHKLNCGVEVRGSDYIFQQHPG